MVLTLDLAPAVARRLQAVAEREGIAVADVVSRLADTLEIAPVDVSDVVLSSPSDRESLFPAFQEAIRPKPPLTGAEWDAFLAEYTEGSENLPVHVEGWTRADYYEEEAA